MNNPAPAIYYIYIQIKEKEATDSITPCFEVMLRIRVTRTDNRRRTDGRTQRREGEGEGGGRVNSRRNDVYTFPLNRINIYPMFSADADVKAVAVAIIGGKLCDKRRAIISVWLSPCFLLG